MEKIESCKFFMENKRRNCKFDTINDSEYCHYHSPNQDFILCPIDNSHSILKSKFETHIKICPKLKYENSMKESLWFSEGINASTRLNNEKNTKKLDNKILVEIQEKEYETLTKLIEKIDIAYQNTLNIYNDQLNDKPLTSDYFLPNLKNASVNVSRRQKDEKQLDLMLEVMKNFLLINKELIYLEYGAGKGHLSHQIAVCNNDQSAHILLEKESRRNKFDKHHRNNKNFIRLRTDINDFNINLTPQLLNDYDKENLLYRVVGVSKHMCGGATDLSLNSLFNLKEKNVILEGICIVTCCHHRCSVESYCNLPFLFNLGFSIEELPLIFKMSSWALTAIYEESDNKKEEEEEKKDIEEIERKKVIIESEKKTQIGFKIKRIIDIGRCLYIKEKTYKNTFLIKYCDLDLTPENFAIVYKA